MPKKQATFIYLAAKTVFRFTEFFPDKQTVSRLDTSNMHSAWKRANLIVTTEVVLLWVTKYIVTKLKRYKVSFKEIKMNWDTTLRRCELSYKLAETQSCKDTFKNKSIHLKKPQRIGISKIAQFQWNKADNITNK